MKILYQIISFIILNLIVLSGYALDSNSLDDLSKKLRIVCDSRDRNKWNPERCFDMSKALSQYDHINSKYTLGRCYLYGFGVPIDNIKGRYWIEKAAKKGNVEPVYLLASLFRNGTGGEKNVKKAIHLYETILSMDDAFWQAEVLVKLARIYLVGDGIEKQPQKALDYLLKAKQLDNTEAYLLLGIMHLRGTYVEKNHNKTLEYFNYAASKGDTGAMMQLGIAYQNGELGLQKSVNKASEWYSKAILTSNDTSLKAITLYANLLVTEFKDEEDADARKYGFEYLKYTANKQYKWAQELLAKYYANGVGTPVDKDQAEYWSKMAEKNLNTNYD